MTAACRPGVDHLVPGEIERHATRFPSEPIALDDEELFCRCTEVIWDGIQSAPAPPIDPGVRAVARAAQAATDHKRKNAA
jgi:hypothetical protein